MHIQQRDMRADTEQSEVSGIPSRNSETSNFQNRRTEFRMKVNLNKKECVEEMPLHMRSVEF
jgi:hypothetical protein